MGESSQIWVCIEIPSMNYHEARELQLALVEARCDGDYPYDVVLLLQHPPVFTLGRRGERKHLMVSEHFLNERGVALLHVERGGDITYHGPGQLVGYFIVDMKANRRKVVDFIEALEEVMIRTARDWGVKAARNPLNRGVWVGPAKLGSLGIAIRQGVSFHGFALNVNNSLEPFQWIHPCGLTDTSMTSMKGVLGSELPMEAVLQATKTHIRDVFRVELEPRTIQDLGSILGKSHSGHLSSEGL